MKIYTRSGDKGNTSNLKGERVSKASPLITLQGEVDELNSHIGYVVTLIENKSITDFLQNIQRHLFYLGVEITSEFESLYITTGHVQELESQIDKMEEVLPELKEFILYGGNKAASYLHVVRSVSRRVERAAIGLNIPNEDSVALSYLNRLSDYFFTLSRYVNFINNVPDVLVNPKRS